MSRVGRVARAGAGITALLLVVVVGIELVLQAFALFAVDRGGQWRPGATQRVLCVGDSHTYGAGVRAEEAYPAQLQKLLDETDPGTYSVVNRGVPGFNTALVRSHLSEWIPELAPTVVVVIAGTNNTWNLTGTDATDGWGARVWSWALRLRTVRFVAVWRAQHGLEPEVDHSNLPFGDRPKYELHGPDAFVDVDGVRQPLVQATRKMQVDSKVVARAQADYEEIARMTERAGIRLVFLGYPGAIPLFAPFSTAMRTTATLHHVPFVDAIAAVQRVPAQQMTWTFGMHAGPAGLTEIARDVAAAVRAPGGAPSVGGEGRGLAE